MNFTPFQTIQEAILAGAKYWSVYDQSGKRLIFEYNQDTAPEDSANKLQALLNREQGEFVQIKLGFRSNIEKGNGGNVKSYTYFYRLPNPGGVINGPTAQIANSGAMVALSNYLEAIDAKNKAEMDLKIMQLEKDRQPSFLEQIGTPENVNKALNILDNLVGGNKKVKALPAINGPSEDIDTELQQAVETIVSFTDGRQAIINIAAAGPLIWSAIHSGLKENKLLP